MGRWLEKARKRLDEVPTELTEPGFVSSVSTPLGSFQEKTQIEPAEAAANPQPLENFWLADVARLLGTQTEVLLEGRHLEPYDLIEQAGSDPAQVAKTIRSSPAWINRPKLLEQVDEQHVKVESLPQRIIQSAATASVEWLAARDQFYGHLIACRRCHASTGRYCSIGGEMHELYNSTPWEANVRLDV